MFVRGQLRFMSRYFLKIDESLVHGAEIFAGYLEGDLAFVKQVEKEKMSRDLFTFQVVEDSVRSRFPKDADKIMQGFVRMLGFDAIVGNNDRHYFNWGVITDLKGRRPARFAPVYDTARALFWDGPESKLAEVERNKRIADFIEKYVDECMPKTGWDGAEGLNHFALINIIAKERDVFKPVLQGLVVKNLLGRVAKLMDTEFIGLFSARRQKFVLECLNLRQQKYVKAVT
jgi:hypothetical protein